MSKKVAVRVFNTNVTNQPAIMLSEAIVNQWKVPNSIILHFGASKNTVSVASAPRIEGIRINQEVANITGLASGDVVSMRYRADSRTLQLGPLFGVLLRRISSGSGKLFGANSSFSYELSKASRLYGACSIFFTPEDINLDKATVNAWVYRKGWQRRSFPLPNVVYNRLTTRKSENSNVVQRFIKDLKQKYDGKVFNERYLNKTEVFNLLKNESELRKYLPESYMYKSYETLKSMCSKHTIVFLKPTRGSLGKGIIRIMRDQGGYVCQHATVSGVRSQKFATLQQCYASISGKLRSQRYQIQQGLQLITINGRPVDFRALVQKSQSGQWSLTSIVARIASSQHFVSNVARGGTISSVKTALAKAGLSASLRSSVYHTMRQAAVQIAEGLQKQTTDHFAELGVDLAVARGGKVWLLEVNSKPSKDDNTPLGSQKIRPSIKQSIQYAKFISGLA